MNPTVAIEVAPQGPETAGQVPDRGDDGDMTALSCRLWARLIDMICFSRPYTRMGFLEQAGIAKRQTASAYLRELERIGLLRSEKAWREVLYVNPKLMEILTA